MIAETELRQAAGTPDQAAQVELVPTLPTGSATADLRPLASARKACADFAKDSSSKLATRGALSASLGLAQRLSKERSFTRNDVSADGDREHGPHIPGTKPSPAAGGRSRPPEGAHDVRIVADELSAEAHRHGRPPFTGTCGFVRSRARPASWTDLEPGAHPEDLTAWCPRASRVTLEPP